MPDPDSRLDPESGTAQGAQDAPPPVGGMARHGLWALWVLWLSGALGARVMGD